MRTLRLLFWLKWKLTLRGYQRNAAQWIGALLMLLIFLPAAVAIGALCYMGFAVLNTGHQSDLLSLAFLGIYGLWLVAPLFGYAFNDAYDITRLFHYPVSIRRIFLGVVCGSLLDLPTLFLLPTLFAAYFGFTENFGGAILNFLAIVLFTLHTFSLSQAIILISAGVLRSRRFRDSLVMLISLAGTLYFIGSMSAAQGIHLIDWREWLESPAWRIVNYFPQGLAAHALDESRKGHLDSAFVYIVLLGSVTAATLALASHFVRRAYADGSAAAPEGTRRKAISERAGKEGFSLLRGLPSPIRALIEKEFAIIRRDPYFRLLLMNFAYVIVFGVSIGRLNAQSGLVTGPAAFGGSGLMLLTELSIVCNVFGTEGGAITLLFLTPRPRREILLAKNLTYFLAIGALNLFYALLIAAISGRWETLPLSYGWTMISLVVFLALGNITSIYAPYRLVMSGWRVRRQSASKGFGYTILYFGMMLLALILLLPVLAAFVLPIAFPLYFASPLWFAFGVPLAVLYALALYIGSVIGASRLLPTREEKIIAIVAQNEE